MSGHSHWSTIKFKKAIVDKKRGKLWSKIARMIIVAAKSGGGDPDSNIGLRYAIDKAKGANMPKDTIEKAIKKGTGELGGVSYMDVLYEGYASGGVAVMVEALTDNRNRTAPEIKKIFERRGGALGAAGCVGWMFSKKGLITVKSSVIGEDDLMEIVLSSGAEDMQNLGEVYEITCPMAAYDSLKKVLEEKKIPTESAQLAMIPQNKVPVNDADTAKTILGLMDELEDHDYVQEVYANFDISDEVLKKLEG